MTSTSIDAWGKNNHHHFHLDVSESSVSYGDNYSTLSWTLRLDSTGYNWENWGTYIKYTVNIGGQTWTNSIPRIPQYSAYTIATGQTSPIYHNDDGTKTINISFSIEDNANKDYTPGNLSKSGTLALTTVPRGAQLSFNSATAGICHIECNLSNKGSGYVTQWQVRQVGSSSVWNSGTCNSYSFTAIIDDLQPNTSYSGTFQCRAYANSTWGDWITLSGNGMTTESLPSVSSTSDVSIDGSVVLQLSDMRYVDYYKFVCKSSSDNTTIKSSSSISINNYNVNLSSSEKSTLLGKYTGATKPKVYWEITIYSEGSNFRIYTNGASGSNPTTIYSIPDEPDYKPTFDSSYILNVKNAKYVEISGENRFISRHNKIVGTIKPMLGKLGSTGSSYSLICGTKQKSVAYSSSNINFEFEDVDGSRLIITAIDSRGKTSSGEVTIDLIDYNAPSFIDFSTTRENGTGSYAILNTYGTYTDFKDIPIENSIQSIKYKSRQKGTSTWSAEKTITADINSGGKWEIKGKTLDTVFSNVLTYDISITISDKFESSTREGTISTADVFIWKDIANKRFGINKKPETTLDVKGTIHADESITGNNVFATNMITANEVQSDTIVNANQSLQIKGKDILDVIYPIGATYITANGINPGLFMEGNWVKDRDIYGGQLIAAGNAWNQDSSNEDIEANTNIAFSNSCIVNKRYNYYNMSGSKVLTFQDGTFLVNPMGIVGLVDVTFTVSGLASTSGTYTGMWFKGNGNPLPSGVHISMEGNGPLVISNATTGYGGATGHWFYYVEDPNASKFYVNPMAAPYNGKFKFGASGTRCALDVKVYSKQGINTVWRKSNPVKTSQTVKYGTGYDFVLNSSGYYESTNQGVDSSWSLCRVYIYAPSQLTATFSYINFAESSFDFGIFSELDCDLLDNSNEDSANVKKSCKGEQSENIQTLSYTIPKGTHFITVKYKKDNSESRNNDSLQFKVTLS